MSTVTDQDLLSPELTGDPFAYYAELRTSDPVHWAPASKAWLLTRYDDVVAAFGDPQLYHERDGRPVRAGDRVFLVLQSANRDESTFADPDHFDIGRPGKPLHVGFGRGVHACLGAQLARIEARVALPRILDRLGDIRVAGDVTWRPNIASRAVTGLRIGYA